MKADFRQSFEFQELSNLQGAIVKDLGNGQVGYVMRLKFLPFLSILIIPRVEDPIALSIANKLSRQYNSIFINVTPKVIDGSQAGERWIKELKKYGYSLAKSGAVPTKTLVLNLELSETELLQQMKRQTRQNINASRRKGVTTEVINDFVYFLSFLKG